MNKHKQKKVFIALMIVIIIPLTLLYIFANGNVGGFPQNLLCVKESQFSGDTKDFVDFTKEQKSKENKIMLNEDNTIKYLYENFDEYKDIYSKEVEQFESLEGWTSAGPIINPKLSKEKYNGEYSLSLTLFPKAKGNNNIVIKKSFANPKNLERWNNSGFITFWMKIEDREDILGVVIRLGDESDTYREFNKLSNLQIDISNRFDKDDPYPDIPYPIKNSSADEWTDFWLNNGWNYLLWRMDAGSFIDNGKVDLSKIKWVEILIENKEEVHKQEILFDDIRVSDGLQRDLNPLGGFWSPPHGRPQYGVFDLNKIGDNDYALKLLNVRSTQYPSNGDHGRMLSKGGTPQNFTLRTRFMLTDFNSKETKNTWFRLMYDFDPSWDPGHGWFGAFISFEWRKFGLITVIPLKRFVLQEQEPKKEKISLYQKSFFPKQNILYEIDLTVRDQKAKIALYEVRDNCLRLKRKVEYEFLRPRYGNDKRYPFAIEITGNVKAIIEEIEILEL